MTMAAPEQVLRGSSLVRAPFTLVGIIGAALTVASAIWIAARDGPASTAAWATLAVTALVGAAGFIAAHGCRVVIGGGEVRDQVAWTTRHRVRQSEIAEIRVRLGAWRAFEMEMVDGSCRVVLGAGPVQFPANRAPDAEQRDMGAIDAMLGNLRA